MTPVSEPSSPKRPLPAMEASCSETTKKLKLEEDVASVRFQSLPKKEKKKYNRAQKLGQRVDIVDGKVICIRNPYTTPSYVCILQRYPNTYSGHHVT
ncbi:unnamed protein product [Absidia cylindrospora]